MSFAGKKVLITGGSRGIGRASAVAFAREGARVAISYRSDEAAAANTLAAMAGTGHLKLPGDISEAQTARSVVRQAIEGLGGLDVVVNNAGIFKAHPIDEVDYEQWQKIWRQTMDVNLTAVANICYCAAHYMMAHGGGHIVNVSSRGAFRGEPRHPAYGAGKAGMNSLSQSLAQALAPHRIYVNVLAPGFVRTDMTRDILDGPEGAGITAQSPLQRVASPEEMAAAILFLASDEAAYTTGAILDMNGASYLRQ